MGNTVAEMGIVDRVEAKDRRWGSAEFARIGYAR